MSAAVSTYFLPLLAKFGHGPEILPDLQTQLGQWVTRSGPLALPPNPMPSPANYWHGVAVHLPLLAKVVLTIFAITPSEACVERSFSNQTLLHTDLRSTLDDSTIQAL